MGMLRRRATEASDDAQIKDSAAIKEGFGGPRPSVEFPNSWTSFGLHWNTCPIDVRKGRAFPLSFIAIVLCWEIYIAFVRHTIGSDSSWSSHIIDSSGPSHDVPITFRDKPSKSYETMTLPRKIRWKRRVREADYGDLEITILDAIKFRRRIHKADEKRLHQERKEWFSEMNAYRVSSTYLPDDELPYPVQCERVAWKSTPKPNCNSIHEIVRRIETDRYLGHGYYRDAWLMEDSSVKSHSDVATNNTGIVYFVLKQMRLPEDDDDKDHMPNAKSFSKILREAVIMEQLTSSPRIVSTYGHCALTVLSEQMPYEVAGFIVPNSGHARQSELDKQPTVQSRNNYTAAEALDIALEMSRAIADLHGYPGTIVHGDIHPVQWLRSDDGQLKLNDFNNAEILDWSRKMNDYCKADRGAWGGMYRAPEEFLGEPIDEKIDVYSMGNNIYTLLTGLWPFYELAKYEEIQAKVLKQERPYVDDRYRKRGYIERSMIDIMMRMWEHEPQNRPSIFEVVAYLNAVRVKVDNRSKKSVAT